jgi:hypothetical protein
MRLGIAAEANGRLRLVTTTAIATARMTAQTQTPTFATTNKNGGSAGAVNTELDNLSS